MLFTSLEQRGMFTKPLPVISVTQRNKAPLFGTCHSCHALFRTNCTDGRLESLVSLESSIKSVIAVGLVLKEAISGVTAHAQRELPSLRFQLIIPVLFNSSMS